MCVCVVVCVRACVCGCVCVCVCMCMDMVQTIYFLCLFVFCVFFFLLLFYFGMKTSARMSCMHTSDIDVPFLVCAHTYVSGYENKLKIYIFYIHFTLLIYSVNAKFCF